MGEKEVLEEAGEEGKGPQKSWGIRASIAKLRGEIRDVDGGITSVLFQTAFVAKFTSSPFLASARPCLPFL